MKDIKKIVDSWSIEELFAYGAGRVAEKEAQSNFSEYGDNAGTIINTLIERD